MDKMNLHLIDRSNYLKGLFITAKLDRQLTQPEKDILKNFSDKLGFAQDFYEETVNSLLSNKYLLEEPIIFSDPKIAKSFVIDAIKLACCNDLITVDEIDWLKKTASLNGIESIFIDKEISNYKNAEKLNSLGNFALFSII